MVLRLISATPSPYARKVRITLLEKGVPFNLETEVPWDSTTKTPQYNPLEKLPVLIDEDKKSDFDPDQPKSVYESSFILEYLEATYPAPEYFGIYPSDKTSELFAKQVQVVSDGVMDACLQLFFERQRDSPSKPWEARQMRKVQGGLKQLANWVGDKDFIIGNELTLADIAAGSILGYLAVRFTDLDWQKMYPNLKRFSEKLEQRESFQKSKPFPQKYQDKIV